MQLSKTQAFYLQASMIVSFLAGSTAPTPLYVVYQSMWHFTPVTITAIFGVYAFVVLASLLVVGSLSDYVGRRPVLFVAALLQIVALAIFATAQGVSALFVARIVQGLGTGAAASAVGAGMIDIDRTKGTIANAVGPMLGVATGGLVSGLMVEHLPAPTKLVYIALAIVIALQAVGVVLMRESVTPRSGALASLKPTFRLPTVTRAPMLIATPIMVAAWSLIGFYGSLGPTLVRRLAGSSSLALGGIVLFVMAASGALTVFFTREKPARTVMMLGAMGLVLGVGIVVGAVASRSLVSFFIGSIVAGAGFGAGFQGAIRSVVSLAAPQERAGVLSILYVVAYLAMGLPAIIGGVRVVHTGDLMTTAIEYGVYVIVLATIALSAMFQNRMTVRIDLPSCIK